MEYLIIIGFLLILLVLYSLSPTLPKCEDISSTKLALICGNKNGNNNKINKILGYYHLLQNGNVILRNKSEDPESIKIWAFVSGDHLGHKELCNEALLLGANQNRIRELRSKWRIYS